MNFENSSSTISDENSSDLVITVLLVEDNDMTSQLICALFDEINTSDCSAYRLDLTRVSNLADGFRKIKTAHFDVVLLDLTLPDSSSSETLDRLEKLKAGEISIIIFSCVEDLGTQLRALQEGAEDYIIKGKIDSDLLHRTILYANQRKIRTREKSQIDMQSNHAERLKSLGLLTAGIAHDFNNLLMVLLANNELTEKLLLPGSSALKQLKKSEYTFGVAKGLTRQLLAYSGRSSFNLEAVDVTGLIHDMRELIETSVTKMVKLNYHLTMNLPAILADSSQLNQIIMNLIINSSEAFNGKSGSIEISSGQVIVTDKMLQKSLHGKERTPGNYVYMQIQDNGCGLSEEIKGKIFDPFFSTKGYGRGLGLSAVWGLIDSLKGIIEIVSESGKGTTIRVLFEASDIKAAKGVVSTPQTDNAIRSGTILVIDDNAEVLSITSALLKHSGFEVKQAASGTQGIDLFVNQRDAIKVVVLDLTLPDMDGLEVFERIRKLRHDIPIVISSGYAESAEVAVACHAAHGAFLQKPYSHAELLKVIKSLTVRTVRESP